MAGDFITVAGTFAAKIITAEGETAPQIAWQITASMLVALVDGEEPLR